MVKNDKEVRDVIFGTISTLGKPIQVVFKNHRCLDCGETGDARLMPSHCHMEPVYVHPGNIVQYHPGRTERHHDSSTVIREHSGVRINYLIKWCDNCQCLPDCRRAVSAVVLVRRPVLQHGRGEVHVLRRPERAARLRRHPLVLPEAVPGGRRP